MNHKSKLDESYLLLKKWWESIEINNYEKGVLNKEIIEFNQQLLRLKDKHLRIGVYGKAGTGKSTILNALANENFFKTGILNGSSKKIRSKELLINKDILDKIELIDFPGFDICSEECKEGNFKKILHLDLILFIVSGDLNRNELSRIQKLNKIGKKIILVLNKTDIWEVHEVKRIKDNIKNKLSELPLIPLMTASNVSRKNYKNDKEFLDYIKEAIYKFGDIYLISNTLQTADMLSMKIKECRLLKRKKEAQAIIGKFATMKASGVALNPLLFLDVAGCFYFDTALIKELSEIYGLQIKNQSARKLIKTISINNMFLGASQISINATLNLMRKISLISAPLSGGFSLLSYGPIAIVQAVLAIKATNLIGKLAAKEILKKSTLDKIEPFQTIKKIALRETNLSDSKNLFLGYSRTISDPSIFIP